MKFTNVAVRSELVYFNYGNYTHPLSVEILTTSESLDFTGYHTVGFFHRRNFFTILAICKNFLPRKSVRIGPDH